MLEERIQRQVEKAIIEVLPKGCQGVLVTGEVILTAAHCVHFDIEGSMVLGDFYIEEIRTVHGTMKGATLAVEPVADIAALGSPDSQEFGEEAEQFDSFCEKTKAVSLHVGNSEPFEPFPVYIHTHKGAWVTGTATQTSSDAKALWIEADEQIEGGTSGSPIVNESGELVGIVSHTSLAREGESRSNGLAPRPHVTLPLWVCRRILGKRFGQALRQIAVE
jgi:hypothetical protein